jgi:hypothetical protein
MRRQGESMMKINKGFWGKQRVKVGEGDQQTRVSVISLVLDLDHDRWRSIGAPFR